MWAAWGWGRRPPAMAAAAPLLLVLRCLAQALATGFHRFLARFSGRRRSQGTFRHKSPPPWTILALVVASSSLFSIVDACSSRTTPKPRPPAPQPRPNITFHTYACPPNYAAWYCLNGATCFTVKIDESLLYNCECAEGYMGPRCEFKDLDRSYMSEHQKLMLETASIAGGATIAVLLAVILCFVVYVHYKRKAKTLRTSADCVDSRSITLIAHPTFGTRWRTAPQVDLPIPHDRGDSKRVECQHVTTLIVNPNNREV